MRISSDKVSFVPLSGIRSGISASKGTSAFVWIKQACMDVRMYVSEFLFSTFVCQLGHSCFNGLQEKGCFAERNKTQTRSCFPPCFVRSVYFLRSPNILKIEDWVIWNRHSFKIKTYTSFIKERKTTFELFFFLPPKRCIVFYLCPNCWSKSWTRPSSKQKKVNNNNRTFLVLRFRSSC